MMTKDEMTKFNMSDMTDEALQQMQQAVEDERKRRIFEQKMSQIQAAHRRNGDVCGLFRAFLRSVCIMRGTICANECFDELQAPLYYGTPEYNACMNLAVTLVESGMLITEDTGVSRSKLSEHDLEVMFGEIFELDGSQQVPTPHKCDPQYLPFNDHYEFTISVNRGG